LFGGVLFLRNAYWIDVFTSPRLLYPPPVHAP
jgi:hypothetical protein